MAARRGKKPPGRSNPEKFMPDKPQDADILRHHTPPRLKRTGIIALCAAGAVAAIGIAVKLGDQHRTADWTEQQVVQSVAVLKPKPLKSGGDLTLAGDIQAFTNAPIY